MPQTIDTQQYVLLPVRGIRAQGRTIAPELLNFLFTLSNPQPAGPMVAFSAGPKIKKADAKMRLLDSVGENGAKLVEMSPEAMLALREEQPQLKIVPVVYYKTQEATPFTIQTRAAAANTIKTKIKVVSKAGGGPVAGATVVAFTDFANLSGAQGVTNSAGEVLLALGGLNVTLDRLYIYPEKGFWGALKKNVAAASGSMFKLTPINLGFTDSLRHFYGNAANNDGQGVKVGVLDTGIALNHPDLVVEGGVNTVLHENANDFGDNGHGHGTHVAGIIGARGQAPNGIRGLAPAVTLRSYRVFGQGSGEASNFAISKAIDRAVADGCDLINMSLGGGSPDDATRAAMEDALAQGVLVLVATGNDDRSPVSFPASDSPPAIAVSAMGRKGTFPAGTAQTGTVQKPFGSDTKNFIADFSNIGPEVDLTAPGVGIISTYPGGYAVMDGTSMACPAATGFAARLLAGKPAILQMQRDAARANAMTQAVFAAARLLNFGPDFEGHGMLL